MNISYLQNSKSKNATWNNISRDERFFCFELYQHLKSDQKGILSLIKEGIIEADEPSNKERINYLNNIGSNTFDIGVEVCFYRDMLKWYDKKIGETDLPHKRTFDLALFSEDAIIIIEAKAQQGFDTKQLMDFKNDREHIKILFNKIHRKKPKVFIIGLHSSKYSPKPETNKFFDAIIKWEEIAEKYPDSKDLFIHANDIYPNKKDSKESKPV